MSKKELLAPAGDFEKLRTAVLYGADAVYIGGDNFSLRANAKNFSNSEMETAIAFAHENGVKVYVAVNILAHNNDLNEMSNYFKRLKEIEADAAIISDLGVFAIAREAAPELNIHISTQANVTNYKSAELWQKLGAKRVVLARELMLSEIGDICTKLPTLEFETFAHGAMCVSYSGRCLLSNAMSGRNANRGECAHPCRYSYSLMEATRPGEFFPIEEDARGSYIMNSKDLCMIEHLPDIFNAGITSLKIEGRVKTPFYVASVVKAYREAIDDYLENPEIYKKKIPYYSEMVRKASHRDYSTGFFFGKPDNSGQVYDKSEYIRNYDYCGVVKEYDEKTGIAVIEQRGKFSIGEEVELLQPKGSGFSQIVQAMTDMDGENIESAPHPKQLIKIKTLKPVKQLDLLIKKARNK